MRIDNDLRFRVLPWNRFCLFEDNLEDRKNVPVVFSLTDKLEAVLVEVGRNSDDGLYIWYEARPVGYGY